MLTQEFVDTYRNKQVPWGFGALSYITFKRTYARKLSDGRLEEWHETLQRCIEGAVEIGAGYTKEESERLFDYMFNLKAIYAGRYLWQLGTDTVRKLGGASLNNCYYTSIRSIDDFCFLMDMLMLGGGVGYSVRKQDVSEIPRIKKNVTITHIKSNDTDFIVPDSREGWILLLKLVLKAFTITGKSLTYSTVLVRSAGEPIKSFGGTASGPQILIDGIEKIVKILQSREGKKLRSIDALDICNIIGSIVVAGNVRRSAQVAIGDSDDYLYIRAKDWHSGNIPNHRAFSNNSIYADNADYLTTDFWKTYEQTGEPLGLFNLRLSQTQGRLGDMVEDSSVEGGNPCMEITLADKESCNLAEIPLNRVESFDELVDIALLLYKSQKACAALPYHNQDTQTIVRKNMRLGLSITGITQSLDKLEWLDPTYNILRAFDKKWSKEHGWNESIKLTTIKPSGSVSLLTGSSPGIHPAYAPFYIRRVRVASDHAIVPYIESHGYKTEYVRRYDGTEDFSTKVIEFVCATKALYADQITAIEQLELVKKLQTIWSDNSISVTVYYKDHELDGIKEWLAGNYETAIKSVSFLRHNDHGFDQAPYEAITEEQYIAMKDGYTVLTPFNTYLDLDDESCEKGVCPIR